MLFITAHQYLKLDCLVELLSYFILLCDKSNSHPNFSPLERKFVRPTNPVIKNQISLKKLFLTLIEFIVFLWEKELKQKAALTRCFKVLV